MRSYGVGITQTRLVASDRELLDFEELSDHVTKTGRLVEQHHAIGAPSDSPDVHLIHHQENENDLAVLRFDTELAEVGKVDRRADDFTFIGGRGRGRSGTSVALRE